MNHGARGVPGARGEAIGGLAAGDLTGLRFQRRVELSLIDDGARLPRADRADTEIGETVILEIKSTEHVLPVTRRASDLSAYEPSPGGICC
jgi:hypothetical protein